MKVLQSNKIMEIEDTQFHQLRQKFPLTLVDLGTGDGKYPYTLAKQNPSLFCIGVDAQAASMEHLAWKASRKPSRGGLPHPNLLYVLAALPQLPSAFASIADIITVNLPWADLLQAVVEPSPPFLECLKMLARPQAWFILQLNMSVFQNTAYVEKLNLPFLNEATLESILKPSYQQAGFTFQVTLDPFLEPFLQPTSWQQRLRLGNQKRQTRTFVWRYIA